MTIPSSTAHAPMALTGEFEDYRDAALDWIELRVADFTADDLRADIPPARPSWPGQVVRTARDRGLITFSGVVRRSTHPARKGSLQHVWHPVTKETTC